MFDKLKQLTKDTAVYGISTMIGRFLTFLLVPFYTNIFLPGEYGIITNIYAFIGILNIFFIYGMDAAYLKFASIIEIGDEKDNFSTPFISVFCSGLILSLVILLCKNLISSFLAIPGEYQYLVYYVAFILFADALAVIPFLKLRLERKAGKFALFKIINICINVFLNVFLILQLKWGIEAVFVSNLVASLFSIVITFSVIRNNFRFSFNKRLFNRLIKFGLPYIPAGLSAMIIQVIDRPIMEHLTNLKTLGIYQANYKLGIFMMLFVSMFQYAWQPFFLSEAKGENPKEVFAKVLTYFTLAAGAILIVLSLFIGDIVKIEIFGRTLIGPLYWSGLDIVPVVLLAYLFNGFCVIFTAGIFIKEKTYYVPVITGIAAAVNIIFNFALIPLMGIMGAALATLASYFVMALGLYIVTQKFYKIDYEYNKIAKIFLSVFILGSVYYVLLYNDKLFLIYKFLLLILFIVSILFFVLEKNEIVFIKKKFLQRD